MMDAELGTAHTRIESLDPIGVDAANHVTVFRVIYGFYVREIAAQNVPVRGLVGTDFRCRMDIGENRCDGVLLVAKDEGECASAIAAFAHCHD